VVLDGQLLTDVATASGGAGDYRCGDLASPPNLRVVLEESVLAAAVRVC
jgi:hypothetical protein